MRKLTVLQAPNSSSKTGIMILRKLIKRKKIKPKGNSRVKQAEAKAKILFQLDQEGKPQIP